MSESLQIAALLEMHRDRPILVTGHRDPDGDCIGSVMAMTRSLRNMGYPAIPVNRDPIPYRYRFLDPDDMMRSPEDVILERFHLAIVLDSSNLDRLGFDLHRTFPHLKSVINVDHHVSNSRFGDVNVVEHKRSAVCEVLCSLLHKLDAPIDPMTANALYTGISTDTGSFQYEATTADTLRTGADLISLGADINLVRENVWENEPFNRIRVLSRVLDNLKVTENGKIAWIKISHAELEHFELDNGDLETFVDYPRTIQGVQVALFFKEIQNGFVKVSIRSKSEVDSNKLAQLFGGGGHKRAAGCKMTGSLDEVEQNVTERFIRELESNGS